MTTNKKYIVTPEWHIFWERLGIFAAIFFISEALISIKKSQDQRKISQAGRIARIIIGLVMLYIDYTAIKSW